MAENYNLDQNHMSKLQQDAIKRAREMQSRARSPQQRNGSRQAPPTEHRHETPPKTDGERPLGYADDNMNMKSKSGSSFSAPAPGSGNTDGLFDYLTKDSERTLILLLFIILLEEKADPSLLFALIYLLI